MTSDAVIDVAGGQAGGAARFRDELYRYVSRASRQDVQIIGDARRLDLAWMLRREVLAPPRSRKVSLNNVGFVAPGGERWTLLRNALHFLTDQEESQLPSSIRAANRRRERIVRLTAPRSDVLVAPCSAMADRIVHILPGVRNRIVVRPHPVSAGLIEHAIRENIILCPVLFEPYKHMDDHISEFVTAVDGNIDPSVKLYITAEPNELPANLASHPRIELAGRLNQRDLRSLWGRSGVIFFPPGLESFGYPLAEARVNGQAIICQDTDQNREIGGSAVCGYTRGDRESLLEATRLALTTELKPDPAPFDPDSYFTWLLGK